jgi:hypothetical protein
MPRSALGSRQAFAQDASAAAVPGGAGSSPPPTNPPDSHPHVHIDGQSESTLHEPGAWLWHVLYVFDVQVEPGWQIGGTSKPPLSGGGRNGNVGTSSHGTIIDVPYGNPASWFAPQSSMPTLPEQVNPGPQSPSVSHGTSY